MDETASFNLIDEPWIRVRDGTGAVREASLLELFSQAPRLKCLANDLPTQDFAILRVLLAILQRAISPMLDDLDEDAEPAEVWGRLWEASELPMDAIEAYLAKWHDRFDLFDPEHPFMQVPGLERANGEQVDKEDHEPFLRRLITDFPSRKNKRLFTNRVAESAARLSYAEGARWLVHVQSFDVSGPKNYVVGEPERYEKGGKTYPGGISWCGKIGCLYLEGNTLKQTLLLNFDPRAVDDSDGFYSDDDAPVWELPPCNPSEGHESRRYPPQGRAELYTWQTRWIRLSAEDDYVTNAVIGSGDKIADADGDLYPLENMTIWSLTSGSNSSPRLTPMEHEVDKALWRGLSSVFNKENRTESQASYRPGIVQWLECLGDISSPTDLYSLHSVGLKYDEQQKSSCVNSFDDKLELSPSLFTVTGERLVRLACGCVDATEKAVGSLWWLGVNLYISAGGTAQKNKNGRRIILPDFVNAASRQAYFELDGLFRQWLVSLSPNCDVTERRCEWHKQARRVLQAIADEAIRSSGPKAIVGAMASHEKFEKVQREEWMNTSIAKMHFDKSLKHALPLEEDEKWEEEING